MSEFLNPSAIWIAAWMDSMWRATWQGGLAILVAWIIIRGVPKLSPRISAWLLRIACLKLFIALCWAAPISLPVLAPPAALPHGPAIERIMPSPEPASRELSDIAINPESPTAAAIASSQPSARGVRWPVVLMGLWLGGVVWQIGRTLREGASVNRRVRQSSAAPSDRLLSAFERQTQRMNIRKPPQLRIGEPCKNPFLAGSLSSAIVLPSDIEARFSPDEIELILAHELGHFVRRDLQWNWLPTIAGWLFSFHPLVWLLARQWLETQEAACDELVLNADGVHASDYGRMLLRVATTQVLPQPPAFASAGVLGFYGQLERRIRSLGAIRRATSRGPRWAIAALLVVGTVGIVPWRLSEQRQSALAEEPVRLSDEEWQKHVVEIHASIHNGSVNRFFPALVVDSVDKSSYVLSSSWGAVPFPSGMGPVEELELVGSGATVETVGYDEAAGTALFLVHSELSPAPMGAWGGDIELGDVLKELKLPAGEETGEHRVRAVGQDLKLTSSNNEPLVVTDSVLLESSIWKTVNNPGSLFLTEGRLVGLMQDNVEAEPGVRRPHLVPMSVVKKAYLKLRQAHPEAAAAKSAVPRKAQPGDYRRPELIALAWERTEIDPHFPLSAWRPDGSQLSEDEARRLAIEVDGFKFPHWKVRDRLRPLVLMFRLDDRIRSEQTVMCSVRLPGAHGVEMGSGANTSRGVPAKSTIELSATRYATWPELDEIEVEARVRVAEPEVIKTLRGERRGPVIVAPGIRWFVDPQRGVKTVGGVRQSGFPAAVLEIDRKVADPLMTIRPEISTRRGKRWREDYATMADSAGTVEIRVSEPLDPENPIEELTFTRYDDRIEKYKVRIRMDLKPKDDPPPPPRVPR